MPTTSNYGFPYPALTDPPDGAGQIGALANAVDTELSTAQQTNQQAREVLVPYASTITLPDVADPTRNTYHDWGSELSFPYPGGQSVTIMAWGMGHAVNDGDGSQHRMRLGISTNGGSSWYWGEDAIDQSGGGAKTRRGGFSPFHMYGSVEPSSSIMVRAQLWWSDAGSGASSMSFNGGRIMALVIPQA